jgi:predicted nucleic acid-binding protein
MSGNKKALIDSNIIIYASKGLVDMEALTLAYPKLYISVITYVEVLGYAFESEEEEAFVLAVLDEIPIIELSKEIAKRAIAYRKKRKIKLPDALILATARHLEAALLSRNLKDFTGLDEAVEIISWE